VLYELHPLVTSGPGYGSHPVSLVSLFISGWSGPCSLFAGAGVALRAREAKEELRKLRASVKIVVDQYDTTRNTGTARGKTGGRT